MNDKLKVLDLFSGIGGFSLGLERTGGFETVAFCETDEFCRRVLAKHWPDVPIHGDIREMTGDAIGPVDIITGGYPCQPFSLAGKRQGAEDDRHLWPEMYRLVAECRPAWVLGENVTGHVTMGLDGVLSDLEGLSYTCRTFVIPACAVDAPHRRERVWILAHCDDRSGLAQQEGGKQDQRGRSFNGGEADVANNAERRRRSEQGRGRDTLSERAAGGCSGGDMGDTDQPPKNTHAETGSPWGTACQSGGRRVKSRFRGVVDGLSALLDRGLIDANRFEHWTQKSTEIVSRHQMREMHSDGTIAAAPQGQKSPQQQSSQYRNSVPVVPQGRAHERRDMGSRTDTDEDLHRLWDAICAEVSPKSGEDLLAQVSKGMGVDLLTTKVENRVVRLRALGNAVVPQVVEVIGQAILEAEGVRG